MNKEPPRRSLALWIVLACALSASAAGDPKPLANDASSTTASVPATSSTQVTAAAAHPNDAEPLQITGLVDDPSAPPINGKDSTNKDIRSHIGLNSKLWVLLNRAPPHAASQYVLFLNGTEIKNLDPATDASYPAAGQPAVYALVFKLKRGKDSTAFWKDLLGSLTDTHVPVTVSLGEQATPGQSAQATIVGADPSKSAFQFEAFTAWRLTLATAAILLVITLVWGHARTRTTLRDNLLPQLEATRQPYSLGRWQMAFWFTLIFAAFVFLFFMLQDTNTLTAQALSLMGISGLTAAASVAVDVNRNTPADDANRGLQALGIKAYEDVLRIKQEIADRQQELASLATRQNAAPDAARATAEQRRTRLQIEVQDRNNVLRTYDEKARPFVSQGWFNDITTDLNGTALHRLQVVCWTLTLGIIFVYGVYRELSMPEFSGTLLSLMGISSAGYVGFKMQEVNN